MNNRRIEQIEKILQTQKQASVAELSSMLKVSDMTIRRYLAQLEQEGRVKRYHGGAIIAARELADVLPNYSPTAHVSEKERIGAAGAEFLKNLLTRQATNSISLLSGTTLLSMARQIDFTIPVTTITDSLEITRVMARNANNNIIFLGGKISAPSLNVYGFLTEQMLNYLSFDYTFTGIAGIDKEGNLYCYEDGHATIIRKILSTSNHVVVLADHSKIGVPCLVRICRMDKHFTLITDQKADKNILNNYKKAGVEIVVCS